MTDNSLLTDYRLDSTRSAVVSDAVFWRAIDDNTPRGQLVWLIRREAGIAHKGVISSNEKWFDYWHPMPRFKDIN